jgi:hypothetical protein
VLEIEQIVHRVSKILFAAKIAFGGEDRGMPEQELDLFQLSAVRMAQLCTGPAQIMVGPSS